MRVATQPHRISMCTEVVTPSSVGRCTAYSSGEVHDIIIPVYALCLLHPFCQYPAHSSISSHQSIRVNECCDITHELLNIYTHVILTDHLSNIRHSVLKASNQVSQHALCCNDCRYRTQYGHDGWRYHEGIHADRQYDTSDVSTVAPAATSITAQSGCFPSIAFPRAV